MGKSLREELKIPDGTFLIGHVSRYDPLKDLNTLMEAFEILKKYPLDFTLVLVGKNLDYDNIDLVKTIEKKELRKHIHLLGMRDDMPAVMNAIDLFVLSSISEAFPNVLNEAMACGVPCVTTNVGDAALIVKNTGWVVPPKNPKLISNAIIDAEAEFRSRNSLWLERKDKCQKRINENFSLEKMTEKYKKVWSNNL